jgi:hypothetical protein
MCLTYLTSTINRAAETDPENPPDTQWVCCTNRSILSIVKCGKMLFSGKWRAARLLPLVSRVPPRSAVNENYHKCLSWEGTPRSPRGPLAYGFNGEPSDMVRPAEAPGATHNPSGVVYPPYLRNHPPGCLSDPTGSAPGHTLQRSSGKIADTVCAQPPCRRAQLQA